MDMVEERKIAGEKLGKLLRSIPSDDKISITVEMFLEVKISETKKETIKFNIDISTGYTIDTYNIFIYTKDRRQRCVMATIENNRMYLDDLFFEVGGDTSKCNFENVDRKWGEIILKLLESICVIMKLESIDLTDAATTKTDTKMKAKKYRLHDLCSVTRGRGYYEGKGYIPCNNLPSKINFLDSIIEEGNAILEKIREFRELTDRSKILDLWYNSKTVGEYETLKKCYGDVYVDVSEKISDDPKTIVKDILERLKPSPVREIPEQKKLEEISKDSDTFVQNLLEKMRAAVSEAAKAEISGEVKLYENYNIYQAIKIPNIKKFDTSINKKRGIIHIRGGIGMANKEDPHSLYLKWNTLRELLNLRIPSWVESGIPLGDTNVTDDDFDDLLDMFSYFYSHVNSFIKESKSKFFIYNGDKVFSSKIIEVEQFSDNKKLKYEMVEHDYARLTINIL